MAKKFLDLYKEVKETVYSNSALALQILGKLNSSVEFTPILAPNGAKGSSSQFTVQRRKRPQVNVVANPNSGSTADALAALDQFTTVDWVSLDVVTGKLRSVGFKETINDDFDFSNSPKHEKDMMYQVGEIAVQRKADLIALFDGIKNTATLPAYVKNDNKVWDAISEEVLKLTQIDDEFKTKTGLTDYVILMDAYTAKDVAKEHGTHFNQEAPIAQTGFISGNSINGTAVIVDSTLPKGSVYIINNEAFAFTSNMIEKPANVDLGLTVYSGRFFYDVLALVDEKRVVKMTGSTTTTTKP